MYRRIKVNEGSLDEVVACAIVNRVRTDTDELVLVIDCLIEPVRHCDKVIAV